jgi:hypothetical protein
MATKTEQATAEQKAKIEELGKKVKKAESEVRKLKKQFNEAAARNERVAPVFTLLENLVNAAYADDPVNQVQRGRSGHTAEKKKKLLSGAV